jgi:hypothetical protein
MRLLRDSSMENQAFRRRRSMNMPLWWTRKDVPQAVEWSEAVEDTAVAALYARLKGLCVTEAEALFASAGWGDWLDGMLFAPRCIFQYYIQAIAAYLGSPQAAGDYDAAATFLVLINARERLEAGSVKAVRGSLQEVVEWLAVSPQRFSLRPEEQAELRSRAFRVFQSWGVRMKDRQAVMPENRRPHAPG